METPKTQKRTHLSNGYRLERGVLITVIALSIVGVVYPWLALAWPVLFPVSLLVGSALIICLGPLFILLIASICLWYLSEAERVALNRRNLDRQCSLSERKDSLTTTYKKPQSGINTYGENLKYEEDESKHDDSGPDLAEKERIPQKKSASLNSPNAAFKEIVKESDITLEEALKYVNFGSEVVQMILDDKQEFDSKNDEAIETMANKLTAHFKTHHFYQELCKRPNAKNISLLRLIFASTLDWYMQYIDSRKKFSADTTGKYGRAFKQGTRTIAHDTLAAVLLNLAKQEEKKEEPKVVYLRMSSHQKERIVRKDGLSYGVDFGKSKGICLSFNKGTLLLSELAPKEGSGKGNELFFKSEMHGCKELIDLFFHGVDFTVTRVSDKHQGDPKTFRKEHPDKAIISRAIQYAGLCRRLLMGESFKGDSEAQEKLEALKDEAVIEEELKKYGYTAVIEYVDLMDDLLTTLLESKTSLNNRGLEEENASYADKMLSSQRLPDQEESASMIMSFVDTGKCFSNSIKALKKELQAIKKTIKGMHYGENIDPELGGPKGRDLWYYKPDSFPPVKAILPLEYEKPFDSSSVVHVDANEGQPKNYWGAYLGATMMESLMLSDLDGEDDYIKLEGNNSDIDLTTSA